MRSAWLLGLGLLVAGCEDPKDGLVPIEGTTYRIGAPAQDGDKNEVIVDMLRSRDECRAKLELTDEQAEDCVPRFDRATGQGRFAFRIVDKVNLDPLFLPLAEENIKVSHDNRPPPEVRVTRHDARPTSQLFILLIDGSQSMHEPSTQEGPVMKVYNALMDPSVIDGFFPKTGSVERGVLLLRFTDQVRGFDGGPPRVITSRKEYKDVVQNYMLAGSPGWTHLYDAVDFSVGKLLEDAIVKDWIQQRRAEPTIVALTDGFNNEQSSDSCGTNAGRLTDTLEKVSTARKSEFGKRPTVYTVGIGRALRPGFRLPKVAPRQIRPSMLCGRYQDSVINRGVELLGIDNASLDLMAAAGGGKSFVKSTHKGLASVFQEAAAERYGWYQVDYRVDGFYHRRSFDLGMRLDAFARGGAKVRVYPSGWVDAPALAPGDDGWGKPVSFRVTLTLLLPLLSLLLIGGFWGPASYNARRALFRRAVKDKGGEPPPSQTPPTMGT